MEASHGSGWRVRSMASIKQRRARTSKSGILYISARTSSFIAAPAALKSNVNGKSSTLKHLADAGAAASSTSHFWGHRVEDNGSYHVDPIQSNDPWSKALAVDVPATSLTLDEAWDRYRWPARRKSKEPYVSSDGLTHTAMTCKSFADATTQTVPTTLQLDEAIPMSNPSRLSLPDPGCWPCGACLGVSSRCLDEESHSYDIDIAEMWDTFENQKLSIDRMHRRLDALQSSTSDAIVAAVSQMTEGSHMKAINDNTTTLVTGVYNLLHNQVKKMQLAIDQLDIRLSPSVSNDPASVGKSPREDDGEDLACGSVGPLCVQADAGTSLGPASDCSLDSQPAACVASGLPSSQPSSLAESEFGEAGQEGVLDLSISDPAATDCAQFWPPPMKCSSLAIGDTVLVNGLRNGAHLNNLVGVIEGFHEVSARYEVCFAPKITPSLINVHNLMHPARCPYCSSEITGSRCFACPSGHLVLHESLRICNPSQSDDGNSLSSDSHMDFSFADSLTPEGPGSHSGNGSQLHANIAQHEDT